MTNGQCEYGKLLLQLEELEEGESSGSSVGRPTLHSMQHSRLMVRNRACKATRQLLSGEFLMVLRELTVLSYCKFQNFKFKVTNVRHTVNFLFTHTQFKINNMIVLPMLYPGIMHFYISDAGTQLLKSVVFKHQMARTVLPFECRNSQ